MVYIINRQSDNPEATQHQIISQTVQTLYHSIKLSQILKNKLIEQIAHLFRKTFWYVL